MPNFSIDAFNSLNFDKKKARERLNSFIKSNPNATLSEIDSMVKQILISEVVYATQKQVLENKDPKAKGKDDISKKYYEKNLNQIKKDVLDRNNNVQYNTLINMNHEDIFKYLSYIQNEAKEYEEIDFGSYLMKSNSDFSTLREVKSSNPRKTYENFEMWRDYDKAFFAVKTDGAGALILRDVNDDVRPRMYKEWQNEIDSIIINPPEQIGDELSEFVVFSELMRPEVLKENAPNINSGSTILGETEVVTDTLTNFFSNTIIGDGRLNMQGIRKCVPQARRNAKEIIEQGNMDRVKEDLAGAFKIMYEHAMSTSRPNSNNFIYPVVKINELIAACQKKGIGLNEIGINEKEIQNIRVLNMKYSLVRHMADLREELGAGYSDYLLSGKKNDPRKDPAFMDKLNEYEAICIAIQTVEKEVDSLDNGYLSAVDKRRRSEVAANRELTFTEKTLMENPEQYIQWIKNKLQSSAGYKEMLNASGPQDVFAGKALPVSITELVGLDSSVRYHGFKELEDWAIEDTLKNIERFINNNKGQEYFIEGSFNNTLEKLEAVRNVRKESTGKKYAERSELTAPKYKELVDAFNAAMEKYDPMTITKNANLNALYSCLEPIDFYLKRKDKEKSYLDFTESISEEIKNTKVNERVYGDNRIEEESLKAEPSKTASPKPVKIKKAVNAPEEYFKQAQKDLKEALNTKGKTPDVEVIKDAYARVLTAYTLGQFRDKTVNAAKQGAIGTDEILKDIMSNSKFEAAVADLKNSKAFEKLCKEVSVSELTNICSVKKLSGLTESYGRLLDHMNGPKPVKKEPEQPQVKQGGLVLH